MTKTASNTASIRVEGGWLRAERVLHRASPHCDDRPESATVELIVIHGISLPPGIFGGDAIDALFMGCLDSERWPELEDIRGLRVSAHLLIRRDGSIIQYVPFDRRAWHAGESCFDGRSRCNDFSVGIELEGCDDVPYAPSQYDALVDVIRALRVVYPGVGTERIVGHCDIAPGRKTDPGDAFDWKAFRSRLERTC